MTKQLTHKEMSSRGGKSTWKNLSKKQRSEIMEQRWITRRVKNTLKSVGLYHVKPRKR